MQMKFLCLKILDKYGWKISGFLDNNEKKWGEKYGNSLIYPPSEIENLQYDVILIALTEQYYEDVYVQLTKKLHVSPDKIHEYTWLLKQEFIKKYRNTKDPEIKATLSYWQNNSISPFNQYINILFCELILNILKFQFQSYIHRYN